MKAERRHELETNDLARKIVQLPNYWKQYGTRIVVGVVVVAAVALLINYRIQSSRANRASAQNAVTVARQEIAELANLSSFMAPSPEMAVRRQQLIVNAQQAIDTVAERSDEERMLAEAAVLRGDLYWTVANLTPLPGAATQPSLQVEPKPDAALAEAASSYRQVLERWPNQKLAAVTARFGLAAVAENQGKWDEASEQYQAIQKGETGEAYKQLAEARERLLGQIQKGTLAQPAGAGMATTTPASAPTTQTATGTGPVSVSPATQLAQ